MTIYQPHQKIDIGIIFIALIIIAFTATALFSIYIYNDLVNLRHSLNKRSDAFKKLEVGNAELKNSLYNILDISNLKSSVEPNSQLILENNPVYLKGGSLVVSR